MPQISINLMPNKAYPILKTKSIVLGNRLGHDQFLKHGKIINKLSPRIIEGIDSSVGCVIFANDKFIAHSAPKNDTNANFISDFVSKKIYELKKTSKSEDVSAVIYGGIAYNPQDPISNASCRLVDAIEEGCKLESVEPTIITGQFCDESKSKFDSYIGRNQITMWGNLIDKIKLTQNATQTEIQRILEELFEYVKIPNKTTLSIINKLPASTEKLVK